MDDLGVPPFQETPICLQRSNFGFWVNCRHFGSQLVMDPFIGICIPLLHSIQTIPCSVQKLYSMFRDRGFKHVFSTGRGPLIISSGYGSKPIPLRSSKVACWKIPPFPSKVRWIFPGISQLAFRLREGNDQFRLIVKSLLVFK